ncbi:MAG: hypothetical protein E7347_00230 [Clostridiales bacterium]|nr:hypothetical protein [Clostridiales bacterium]
MAQKFGLIGKTLKHSYSKKIHALLGDYPYEMHEIAPEQVGDFVLNCRLNAFNVTIPYKKDVIPYLDEIDERALLIGAVNTVVKRDGKIKGYNTDFDGMVYMLSRAGITLKDKNVLILGSGGTSNTAQAVSKSLGAKNVSVLSRTGQINYENYKEKVPETQVVINTTPVGMFPENYTCKIDLDAFPMLSGVADAVYNPALTLLLYQAKKRNLPYTNGLPMLVAQAKYALELFIDKKVSDSVIEPIISELEREKTNIVLVGMPGSGKTSVGQKLASELSMQFIDTDELIVKRENRDIPQIFKDSGEEYFRKVESEVLREVGTLSGKIISTGGGVIKNAENYFPLKQNSVMFWINRDVEKLVTDGRPLSKDLETVKKLYLERKDAYTAFADVKVDNNGDINDTVKGVISAYENFSH